LGFEGGENEAFPPLKDIEKYTGIRRHPKGKWAAEIQIQARALWCGFECLRNQRRPPRHIMRRQKK